MRDRLFLCTVIFRLTKGKNEVEDGREKDEADLESGAFVEGAAKHNSEVNIETEAVEARDDRSSCRARAKDEAAEKADDKRNKEDVNPEVYVDDAAEDIDVIDRDERLPTFFSGFCEDFPPSDDC